MFVCTKLYISLLWVLTFTHLLVCDSLWTVCENCLIWWQIIWCAGPVFGNRDYFSGLAIFLDTYPNVGGEHGVSLFGLFILLHVVLYIGMYGAGTVMCCEKMTMTRWRNVWSMKLWVQDQGEDQRRPGKRLYVRTVKHVSWIKRMPWTVANGERW